ncbi:MAG: UPF0280 family protein [Candidatus Methanoplasma sp.]|jgi:ApbE superfamily uncharacterized protein (UPF0280 family)|nr:UPF0280 family protein [Candidatus Methanoplasma sp.]
MTERMHIHIGETELALSAEPRFRQAAVSAVREARSIVREKIDADPFFGLTFHPCEPARGDRPLIRRMCAASVAAGVGPMAAVAGAVASHVAERLAEEGCSHAVIDNGGDVALMTSREAIVRIYSGDDSMDDAAFAVPATGGRIMGLCSSSGRVGRSVSLGNSDLSAVFSGDPVLADACATRLGNMISSPSDLKGAAEEVCGIGGVIGCLAMMDGSVAVCGDMPRLAMARGRG